MYVLKINLPSSRLHAFGIYIHACIHTYIHSANRSDGFLCMRRTHLSSLRRTTAMLASIDSILCIHVSGHKGARCAVVKHIYVCFCVYIYMCV
jgi:hypothetical protein